MWNFILGFLFTRATGTSRYVRAALVLITLGILIAGLIYAAVVLRAVSERSHPSHVPAYHSN